MDGASLGDLIILSEVSLLTDGLSCSLFLLRAKPHPAMDTMFFVGINAGLLVLLVFGLVSAKDKIKAGRKEII